MSANKTGVVLVNLGTPDEPDAPAIRRYLREFLSDPRVVNLPRWLWLPILHLIILRVRPPRLVHKYRLIWGKRDGPIRNITRALADRLQQRFPPSLLEGGLSEQGLSEQDSPKQKREQVVVASAMTYGTPSIAEVVKQLHEAGVSRLLFVPLYPQYAGATVGAVADRVKAVMRDYPAIDHSLVEDYHQNAHYLIAVRDMIVRSHAWRRHSRSTSQEEDARGEDAQGEDAQEKDGKPLVIFSFHGIPQAQSDAGDPYRQQCEATARGIAKLMLLAPDQWRLTFQSRFGPAKWLQPYTDKTLASLPSEGATDVLLVCPGFSVDCLETLEEIKVLNRKIFLAAGGKHFGYVKALNATKAQVDLLEAVVEAHLTGTVID